MAPKPKAMAPESTPKSPQKRNGPRPTSPSTQCLRHPNSSPQKPRRKPKPKPAAATPDEVAAQIAARIAQLSVSPIANAPPPPAVKVKSIAELRSTKIARLTTKIAVNEAEIARLEREYALAKERLDRETEALEYRRVVGDDAKTKATLALMDDARAKLETVAERAQDLLGRFRGGEINERATMRELKDLLEGAKDGGCDVAGLCKMVAALDFTAASASPVAGVAPGVAAGVASKIEQPIEAKVSRKRKVQDVKAEERRAVVESAGQAKADAGTKQYQARVEDEKVDSAHEEQQA